MRIRFELLLLSAVACGVLAANAQAQHSDVLLRSDGTKVLIGGAVDLGMEEGGPFFNLDTNVFEGVFLNPAFPTPPFGYAFERDEPGFYSEPGLSVGNDLPANADITLALSPFTLGAGFDSAHYWDGTGPVNFTPLSTAQPGVAFAFAPGAPTPFASTSATGFVDDHPLFGLTGPAADGVYLTSMTVEVEGLVASEPFYMVWLASSILTNEEVAEGLEEALEAFENGGPAPVVGGIDFSFFEEAVEFAEGIPEPTAGLLLATGAAAVLARRSD